MINYDSIISAYNDKPTLMEWLKKVEEALKGASATSFSVNKKGNATISFQINFDDGTSLESGDIVLQQGESVASAAIVNGHLVLTLTNGDELDAGDLGAVSGFSIDGSQHLIVTYQDGTTNDLGAIFNGNVNISGDLSVTGSVSGDSIVERMTGYSFASTNSRISMIYAGACKNGNKLTFSVFGTYTSDGEAHDESIGTFTIPAAIGNQLVPYQLGSLSVLSNSKIDAATSIDSSVTLNAYVSKYQSTLIAFRFKSTTSMTSGTSYLFRYEVTFLLSENLAA